jgi:alpha-amylase
VFHDVADEQPGTLIEYRAVVLDNASNTRTSGTGSITVAPPAIALETPSDGGRVRGTVEVRAIATPDHPHYAVTIQRSVAGGPFTDVGTDSSSPVYTAFDDTSGLPDQARVTYRAVLTYEPGRTVTSQPRTVTVVQTPVTTAVINYIRPGGDYANWGLHLWGEAIADGVATDWFAPRPPTRIEGGVAIFEIPLKDDTKPVNFIVHTPGGDSVPTTREPGGDRSFVPLDHPQIWLKQGDPAIYFSRPG